MAKRCWSVKGSAEAFADLSVRLADGEGDAAEPSRLDCKTISNRSGWWPVRGPGPLSSAVFEAWNGLVEGLLSDHDQSQPLESIERLDLDDGSIPATPGVAVSIAGQRAVPRLTSGS